MAFSHSSALDLLRRAIAHDRLAHAYLISGPAGSGVRELAASLATAVNRTAPGAGLSHPDVHIAEPESKSRRITVDQVRFLEKELQMRSLTGGRKIAIIFDADRMVPMAANAFLKTLEEPPANSLLILTTAHPEMLLDTIISRCIPVGLMSESVPELTEAQRSLVARLEDFFQTKTPGVGHVYQLVRHFQALLAEMKAEIQATQAEEMKREEAHYKQTTDGRWLADRENYYKALIESQYLQARLTLVDTLMQWWADILRHQQGSARLDLPGHEQSTAPLAPRFTPAELLRRITAIEQLRELLGTNVQEALAIETSFLEAFAEESSLQKCSL